MTTRRRFLSLLAAGAAALGLPRFGRAAGRPGRQAVRKGVPGVTYFRAGAECGRPLRDRGLAVCLDGRDVMHEAFEADLAAGWVRMWTAAEWGADGRPTRFVRLPDGRRASHYAFGRVELRPDGLHGT